MKRLTLPMQIIYCCGIPFLILFEILRGMYHIAIGVMNICLKKTPRGTRSLK